MADLENTKLCGVNLTRACLKGAQLINTDLCNATLTGNNVYGASVWDIKGMTAPNSRLRILISSAAFLALQETDERQVAKELLAEA